MTRKFKVTIAGCGGMANKWVQYALSRKDIEIAALMDIKKENAQAMAEKYDIKCGIYDNLKEAIRESNSNLLFDITIPDAHRETVITAMKMGCDVFGEKPMASSIEEAREMVISAHELGKSYSVMQNRRYLKDIRALRGLIEQGAIGELGFISADFFLGPHFGGFREIMESPLILDMAIHTFDQARFITGADAVSVYCHEFNPPGSWYKGNASAICIFEMSDGSVFCYRGSWCAEGAPTSWEADWRVNGSKGTALWNGIDVPYAEVVDEEKDPGFFNQYRRVNTSETWQGREGHEGCLDDMFAALINGEKAETDCNDNINSMAMVFGALDSAKKGIKIIL
jgi:predicted dehydrogenase